MPSLSEIAEQILLNSRRLDEHVLASGLPKTSFENDTLGDLPADLEECRKQLVDSTWELKALAQGPMGQLMDVLFTVSVS